MSMKLTFILAQIMGIIGIVIWVISIILKEKKNILACQIVANVVYAIEYSLLEAYETASMNLFSVTRLVVYYFFERKNKTIPFAVLLLFLFIITTWGIVFYVSPLSLIPIFISLLYAYAFWQSNLFITRLIYIGCAIMWIFYNLEIGAYVAIVGNVFEIVAAIAAILKYREHSKVRRRKEC